MRISDKMNQNQFLNNVQKNRTELSSLQNQAATMKRINKPSDDPIGAAKALQNRTENKNLEQFDRNILFARSFLENSESTLSQLGEAVVRAKELAMQGANDTNGGVPRQMISEEVSQIYNSVVEMSNRRFGERYIFGGYQTTEAPFTKAGEFRGDNGQIQIQNHKGQFLPMNLSGAQIFLGENLGYEGAIKRQWEVPKTLEELQDFKISEVQKEIEHDVKNEDLLELRGPASVGRVQRLSEKDPINGQAGANVFSLITTLEAALRTNDKIAIQSVLEPLDQALNQINLARAEVGGRLNQMNATSDGIQKTIVENKAQNSLIEDADLFKVMTDLNKSDTALKATLETSSKMMNQSLLDFLR
ncbi:MAG: flagellar hook-associated protein FlgL [Bdellovibrionaceae bacterium]|nr:flagellar hook-associated protein FlgL [Pseudobdellovibrionaceae bacterium]